MIDKYIFTFIFFGNEFEVDNSKNENNIGNSETSKTKIRYRKYTGHSQNLKYES